MADALDLSNIDSQLQQAVNMTSQAGQNVVSILPTVQDQQQQLAEKVDRTNVQLESATLASFDRLMEIQDKAAIAQAHPINMIFGPETADFLSSVGLVNEDLSFNKLKNKVAREDLMLKKIDQQAKMFDSQVKRVSEQITRPLTTALQSLEVGQAVVGAQKAGFDAKRSQFDMQSSLIAQRVAAANEAVTGATPEALQEALKSGNTDMIGPGVRLGHIEDELLKKKTSRLAFSERDVALKSAKLGLGTAEIKAVQDAKANVLTTAPSPYLSNHLIKAVESEANGKMYEMDGLPVTSRELQTALTTSEMTGAEEMEKRINLEARGDGLEAANFALGSKLSQTLGLVTQAQAPMPANILDVDVSTLPAELQASMIQVQDQARAADEAKTPMARAALLERSNKTLTTITTDLDKRYTENLPKEARAATSQFLINRQMEPNVATEYLMNNLLKMPALLSTNDANVVVDSAFIGPNAGMNTLLKELTLAYKDKYLASDAGGISNTMPGEAGSMPTFIFGGDNTKPKQVDAFSKAVDSLRAPSQGKDAATTRASDQWLFEYIRNSLAVLQEEEVLPGFQGLINTSTGDYTIPGAAGAAPNYQTIVNELYRRGEEEVKKGTIGKPTELFDILFRELNDNDNIGVYSSQMLKGYDVDTAAVLAAAFGNKQEQVFRNKILGLRSYMYQSQTGPVAINKANQESVIGQTSNAVETGVNNGSFNTELGTLEALRAVTNPDFASRVTGLTK